MKSDLKPFVDAILEKNAKSAREKLEEICQKPDLTGEIWRGYRLALQGMVAALETGDELTLIRRIVDGKCLRENIQELIRQMRDKTSQEFRPEDERGFSKAWMDVLQILLEKLESTAA